MSAPSGGGVRPGHGWGKLRWPPGAELYRRQVALGLEGDPQATLKARVFLRDWFGGKIRLEPLPDGGLMAHWNQSVGALLKGLGSCGSGGMTLDLETTVNFCLAA